MKQVLQPRLDELPDPRQQPADWELWWRHWPQQWKQLVKLYVQRATSKEAEEEQKQEAEQERAWQCGDCAACFVDRQALLAHARVVHGVRTTSRRAVLGSICPHCGTEFHHRLRAIRHIETAFNCNLKLRTGAVQLLEQDDPLVLAANATDQAWIKERKRVGRNPLGGPPPVRVCDRASL